MLLMEVLRKWAIIIKKLLRHFLAQIPTQEHCFTCGYLPTTIVFGHLFSSFSFLSNFWLFWYISKPYSLNSIIPPAHCSRLHSSCPSLGPCLMTRTFGIRNPRIAQDTEDTIVVHSLSHRIACHLVEQHWQCASEDFPTSNLGDISAPIWCPLSAGGMPYKVLAQRHTRSPRSTKFTHTHFCVTDWDIILLQLLNIVQWIGAPFH